AESKENGAFGMPALGGKIVRCFEKRDERAFVIDGAATPNRVVLNNAAERVDMPSGASVVRNWHDVLVRKQQQWRLPRITSLPRVKQPQPVDGFPLRGGVESWIGLLHPRLELFELRAVICRRADERDGAETH